MTSCCVHWFFSPILTQIYWHCIFMSQRPATLQWRHNECDGISNHQPHDCLFNRLFRRRSKKTPNSPVNWGHITGEFPAQRASNAENISISWRHHKNLSMHQLTAIPSHPSCISTYCGLDKIATILQATFPIYLIVRKLLYFKFRWNLFPGVQLTINHLYSDNDLAPNAWQAIICSENGLNICANQPW